MGLCLRSPPKDNSSLTPLDTPEKSIGGTGSSDTVGWLGRSVRDVNLEWGWVGGRSV